MDSRNKRIIGVALAVAMISSFAHVGCNKKPLSTADEGKSTDVQPSFREAAHDEGDVLSQDLKAITAKYLMRVHFDFDKAQIRPDAKLILEANADFLRKYPSVKVLVEGHCDERGSVEYNLALGERRAKAARDYLVNLGVDTGRITTVSYGKELPADPTHHEEAWALNRRAQFVAVAK